LLAAQAAMDAAREAGIEDHDISLVAREDIEMQKIPDHRLKEHHDVTPSAVRGICCGGGSGLLLGLIAIAVPPLGITLAGAGAMVVAGAAMGAWTGALVGFDVDDAISRKFRDEIAAGCILVVLDGDKEKLMHAKASVERTGAIPMPFHAHTVLT
jgi:uncharacterized membrane protein